MQHPDVMINLSASPYNYAQDIVRNSIVKAHTIKYKLPMLYCNTIGSQTEIVFDGGSLVYDSMGNKVQEMKYFEEDYQVFELNSLLQTSSEGGDLASTKSQLAGKTLANAKIAIARGRSQSQVEQTNFPMGDGRDGTEAVYFSATDVGVGEDTVKYLTNEKNIGEIYQALVLGIRDYFSKMGFTKAILGSSGGIDSAVTQALGVAALGKENVRAVLMPSQYSSSHSVTDAEQLGRNLGNPFDILPIKNIYESFLQELKPIFKDLPFGVAEENIQSRTRGNLLMAIANKFGYILLNTSNKSELATGYGTLYGDMAGGLGVLGDVYKVQVFALAKYINRDKEIIPMNILLKPPSAELKPGSKTAIACPNMMSWIAYYMNILNCAKGQKKLSVKGLTRLWLQEY